jgi:hypothetical protein
MQHPTKVYGLNSRVAVTETRAHQGVGGSGWQRWRTGHVRGRGAVVGQRGGTIREPLEIMVEKQNRAITSNAV